MEDNIKNIDPMDLLFIDDVPEIEPAKIVKTKEFDLDILSEEQAIDQLELIGNDFYIYRDNKLNPIKYVYNDQGVVTFEEFGKNVIYKYNKNCYDEFYSSIKEYKTGVVQFFVPGLDSDFNFTINIDNESGNIVIIFSPDKPIYYED